MQRIAGRFARVEPRRRVRDLILGLLSDLPRKNCWTIAEHIGHATPDGLQHLLGRAKWDADLVRDDLRDFVLEHLADDQAVLVVDETGDLKKGTRTVGVQRQYTGTAGRIENAQVAVYLTYTSRHGHAGVDRALYLPKSWTRDEDRRQEAAVPDELSFATKPQLAQQMIERALDAGAPAAWAAGDEVYGDNPKLRAALEARGLGYVLAVSCTHRVPTAARRPPGQKDPAQGLAEAVRRTRREGPPLVRLGPGRDQHRSPGRASAPADPPQPCYRGTGLLPLLLALSGSAVHAGEGRRKPLDGGGNVPELEGTGRARRTPGAALGLLAPLGHPGPARPCLPRRHHLPRTPRTAPHRRRN